MSSKRHMRRKGCTGKIVYATVDAAKAAVRSMFFAGKLSRSSHPVTPYRCPFGAHYHVGHRPHHHTPRAHP